MLWNRKIQKNYSKNSVIALIFKEYKKYQILFKQESNQDALLKRQSWNYEIKFINDKKFTKQFIYLLSTEKLNVLR